MALRSQVPQQLFLQHSAGLNEQTAENRFVRHAHALVRGILDFQPSGNLLRRPVQNQFTRNQPPQLRLDGRRQRSRRKAISRLADPLPGRDIRGGRHGVRLPGSPSKQRVPELWLYRESRNQKPAPREMSSRSTAVSTSSERRRTEEQCHRAAIKNHEWKYAACQRRAQSCAATPRPSSGSTARSAAPQKAPPVSLASCTPPLNRGFY